MTEDDRSVSPSDVSGVAREMLENSAASSDSSVNNAVTSLNRNKIEILSILAAILLNFPPPVLLNYLKYLIYSIKSTEKLPVEPDYHGGTFCLIQAQKVSE